MKKKIIEQLASCQIFQNFERLIYKQINEIMETKFSKLLSEDYP